MPLKRIIISSIALIMAAASPAPDKSAQTAYDKAAAYVLKAVKSPTVAYVGGDWAVVGLTAGGAKLPKNYLNTYHKNVVSVLKAKGGVLSGNKYTEYSRVIIGISAAGYDASNIKAGKTVYDLTARLKEVENVCAQGINGAAYALMALDSSGGEPYGDAHTRAEYVEFINTKQLPNGGFNISGKGDIDPDVTAAALRAIAPYADDADTAAVIGKAAAALSAHIRANGVKSSETAAQAVLALKALDIGIDDKRFQYGGKNLVLLLLSYQNEDGGFCHAKVGGKNGASDEMATEQALMALAAVK